MTSMNEKVFAFIRVLSFFLALSLMGSFSGWINFIPQNYGIGLSILFALIAMDVIRSWLQPPRVEPSRHQAELVEWEKVRVKGKLHYVLVHDGGLVILAGLVIIIFLQITNKLGVGENFNLYTVACDAAILAAIYGVRVRNWQMREEEYTNHLCEQRMPSNAMPDRNAPS